MKLTQKSTGRSLIFTPKTSSSARPYKNYKNLASSVSTALKKAKGKLS